MVFFVLIHIDRKNLIFLKISIIINWDIHTVGIYFAVYRILRIHM